MAALDDEGGVGLVSTLTGVMAFLTFLFLAVQMLVHLFAVSYVNAAAFDAARVVSGSGDVSPAAARAHGMGVLGSFSSRVSVFDIEIEEDDVTVRVQATSPALLPRLLSGIARTDAIDRAVTLRRERPQCDDC